VCEIAFLHAIVCYLIAQSEEIRLVNLSKDDYDQLNIFYLCLASRFHVRLIVGAIINVFVTFMVLALLSFQLKFIALGYTTQFGPPSFIYKAMKQMRTTRGAILFRLENLYTFFFKSIQENDKVYFKYQKECWSNAPAGSITDGLYPKDAPLGLGFGGGKENHVEINLN
jgi:hypothetical protein